MKTVHFRRIALISSAVATILLTGCSTFAPAPTPWIIPITATPESAEAIEELGESESVGNLPTDLPGTDGGCGHILWPLADGRSWQFRDVNTGEGVSLSSQQVTDGSFSLGFDRQAAPIGCTDGTLTGLPPSYLLTHPALPGMLSTQNAQGALLLDPGQLLPYSTTAASWDYQADIRGTIQIEGANVTISEGRFVTVFTQQGITPVNLESGEVSGVTIAFQTFMEINGYSGIDENGPLLIQTSGQLVFAEGMGLIQVSYNNGLIARASGNTLLPGGTMLRLVTVSG